MSKGIANVINLPIGSAELKGGELDLITELWRLRDEVEELRERDRVREEELRELRERDRFRAEEAAQDRRRIFDLESEKEATPGRETKDRINELLSALTRNGNRPIELASFGFDGGRLSKQQRKRLVSHLRDDPLFEVPERPAGRKLFVHLAGKPVKPR